MENRLKTSGFRHSNSFHPSNTGLITTVAQGSQEEDVRKSRIQHLPSYRKGDLSDKLQFVVVFQTIEIERLSIEIQSLRVKLKDSDRQIRIYLNYEVQIKELTENCHQLQQQRAYYQNQIEQMSLACNSLYQELTHNKMQHEKEIQDLKGRFYTSQAELQKENQSLMQTIKALQVELLKKNEKQKETEAKLKSISQQLAKANQTCLQNQNEVALLKERDLKKSQEIRKAQAELTNWQKNYKQQKREKQQNQRQLQQQKREQERLINNLILQNKNLTNEVDNKKTQIIAIVNSSQNNNKLLDNNKRQLQSSKKQNENIKSQFEQLKNQYNRKENELNQLQKNNQQLKNQTKSLILDSSQLKDRLNQINDFAIELKTRIEVKSKQVQGFKKYLLNFQQQCRNNSKRQAQLVRKVSLLQPVLTQNNSLQQTIFQLHNKLSEKQLQVNGKQRSIIDLTISNKELSHAKKDLQAKNQRKDTQLRQVEDKMRTQRQNNERQKKQLKNESQQIIDRLSQQKKSLTNHKERLEKDIQKMKYEGLIKEEMRLQIKRLNENCKRQEKDIQTLNSRLQNIATLMKKIKEKYSQFNQIEKANGLLKKQLESSFTLIDKMIQKIGAYEQQIENLTDQNWRLTDKMKQEYYKDQYFSTSSSTKTIESQYNNTPKLINSTRFSSFQQTKPFEPFGFGALGNFAPSLNLSVSNVRESPILNTESNIFRSRDFQTKKSVLQTSTLYPSRQSNVYSSMVGQYSSRGGFDTSQNSWERK